ncbi:hypothetical protein [Methylocaldum szegediense]|uniref:Uncharacterized protein n=1 Tax=Methylocaldum szegediense TaxID=73780 RepID=A0ABM9I504_9GAMM|nr:hypothetical protein [Methylocaldum szegediense]CAI8896891.1 protein of unknown function [Methylocaldum szegediense]
MSMSWVLQVRGDGYRLGARQGRALAVAGYLRRTALPVFRGGFRDVPAFVDELAVEPLYCGITPRGEPPETIVAQRPKGVMS